MKLERNDKKAVVFGVGLLILLGIGLNIISNNVLTDAERELSRTSPDEFGYKNKLSELNQTRQESRMFNTMGNSIIFFGFFAFLILITFEFDEKFEKLEKRLNYIINTMEREKRT